MGKSNNKVKSHVVPIQPQEPEQQKMVTTENEYEEDQVAGKERRRKLNDNDRKNIRIDMGKSGAVAQEVADRYDITPEEVFEILG